ncbi:hypothetical protein [Nannocystis pusilla]|uniref:hypothetical protein n=1 Tax=Nannocystis pusilla TaxID=889268 RepID=UPI003B793839
MIGLEGVAVDGVVLEVVQLGGALLLLRAASSASASVRAAGAAQAVVEQSKSEAKTMKRMPISCGVRTSNAGPGRSIYVL